MRVFELAQQLGVEARDLLLELAGHGYILRSSSSKLDPEHMRQLQGTYPGIKSQGTWKVRPNS